MIEKLTPEQEAQIPLYREKWRSIALSTEPIDRQKAAEAVKLTYEVIDEEEPEIIFAQSPYAALEIVTHELRKGLKRKLGDIKHKLRFPGLSSLSNQVWSVIGDELRSLWDQIGNERRNQILLQLKEQIPIKLRKQFFSECIPFETWTYYGSYFDFNFSILKLPCDGKMWLAFHLLVSECGWIFPYEKICVVCDRPRILSFDSANQLHAEGSPAIEFVDGFQVYAYRGVRLPFKYRKIHPNQWKADWLLDEKNVELRRALIQGIGYPRICKELYAVEIDSWQEYSLLKVDEDADLEPIRLLKMTCPSTGYIHVLRVPPALKSAREAICWVNWGTDPEEFSIQT
ncbi:hypothetical protein H6S82_14000 [Planktothrix sp. FACHB-1355]|uniref:DUF6745 domain-containing protein n=1 Tax=Aerosakkonema funiforme FACHB-1375 TaxID=2949571 RepID=A0A926VJB5_9CYAN|nr:MULTISPECIES: hypothetical protein [Oscillatoriales]MBD2184248.1 hypothetical protein [Aerosakkonema funiforme FACHB-1375]MBD3559964.1 hypothetical protein [Planktothrix sp. FACHB-1355]